MESKFICFKCDKCSPSSDTLLSHIKIFHPLLQRYDCKQSNCRRSFSEISNLRKHFNSTHNDLRSTLLDNTQSVAAVPSNLSTFQIANSQSTRKSTPYCNDQNAGNNDSSKTFDLTNEIALILSRLYSISSLPRNIVQIFFDSITELINSILQHFHDLIYTLNLEKDVSLTITGAFHDVKNKFLPFASEYLRLKYFQNSKYYINPEPFDIDEHPTSSKASVGPSHIKKTQGQKVSLHQTLKNYLELPNVFNTIINFIKSEASASSDVLSSILQGELWTQMRTKFRRSKIVLPLLLYFDDFEPCNPLGSKAGIYKIGAVYISLACIPPELVPLLENIFVSQLFYSSDRTFYGNRNIFGKLIEELKFLELNGIEITVDSKKLTVHFTLLLIIGDNLGLNSILGFHESFSSHYFCRICITRRDDTKSQILENVHTFRTAEDYKVDSATNSHGIKETCIFNDLPNFNVIQNATCDLMHDLLEGVLRYDMAHIINFLIEKRYFTLTDLNHQIHSFNHSKIDVGNPIPRIKQDHLKKCHLVMSASEMLALVTYFGTIIGYKVPESDQCWSFYIIVHQIMYILLSRVISRKTIDHLKVLIEEHHTMYCQLFDDTLKPKHHFLLHYPGLILKLGPLRYVWAMRYEAFHKILKSAAQAVTSRKNILKTLMIKQQLRFSYKLFSQKGFSDDLDHGPSDDILSLCDSDLIKHLLDKSNILYSTDNSFSVSWIQINNFLYKLGFVLQLSDSEKPSFGTIKYIICCNNEIHFIVLPLLVIGLNHHLQAYELKDYPISTNAGNNYCLLSRPILVNKLPYNVHMTDGKKVISILQ